MNSIELLLTLVFIVIIYMVVAKGLTSDLVVGAAALWFVILWIGFDNMGAWTPKVDKMLESCGVPKDFGTKLFNSKEEVKKQEKLKQIKENIKKKKKEKKEDIDRSMYKEIIDIQDKIPLETSKIADVDTTDEKIKKGIDSAIQKTKKDAPPPKDTEQMRPMPLTYSEDNYKYNLFDEIGCLGDNMIAHKMKQVSNRNREAMDNFSRTYTKYSNINYFEQELKDAANSHGWWENDELEKEF